MNEAELDPRPEPTATLPEDFAVAVQSLVAHVKEKTKPLDACAKDYAHIKHNLAVAHPGLDLDQFIHPKCLSVLHALPVTPKRKKSDRLREQQRAKLCGQWKIDEASLNRTFDGSISTDFLLALNTMASRCDFATAEPLLQKARQDRRARVGGYKRWQGSKADATWQPLDVQNAMKASGLQYPAKETKSGKKKPKVTATPGGIERARGRSEALPDNPTNDEDLQNHPDNQVNPDDFEDRSDPVSDFDGDDDLYASPTPRPKMMAYTPARRPGRRNSTPALGSSSVVFPHGTTGSTQMPVLDPVSSPAKEQPSNKTPADLDTKSSTPKPLSGFAKTRVSLQAAANPADMTGEAETIPGKELPIVVSDGLQDQSSSTGTPTASLATQLRSGSKLKDDAIHSVLKLLTACAPSFLDIDSLRTQSKHSSRLAVPPTVDTLLLPIHQSDHWTLAVVHLPTRQIHYFNSLQRPAYLQEAKSVLKAFFAMHMPADEQWDHWRIAESACAQQTNGVDCGVFVLVCAMYAVTLRFPMPARVDICFWRQAFTVLLTGHHDATATADTELRISNNLVAKHPSSGTLSHAQVLSYLDTLHNQIRVSYAAELEAAWELLHTCDDVLCLCGSLAATLNAQHRDQKDKQLSATITGYEEVIAHIRNLEGSGAAEAELKIQVGKFKKERAMLRASKVQKDEVCGSFAALEEFVEDTKSKAGRGVERVQLAMAELEERLS